MNKSSLVSPVISRDVQGPKAKKFENHWLVQRLRSQSELFLIIPALEFYPLLKSVLVPCSHPRGQSRHHHHQPLKA